MNVFMTEGAVLSGIVTILAALVYLYMGIQVGRMRGKHGVKAPAMSGHPDFERANRVHYNTLESLPVFFAALWLATIYFHALPWIPALIGLVVVIGRVFYMTGYMADPSKRGFGFGIAFLGMLVLMVLALIGLVQTWMALNP